MDSKHTPGPWTISGSQIYKGKSNIASCYARVEDAKSYGIPSHGVSKEKMYANTQLIAAAPDLLEACQKALEYIIEYTDNNYTLETMIEKAISKATGK